MAPLRVHFVCTGLGREARGFETFTRSCAAALRGESAIDLTVFAGGRMGHVTGERVMPNLPRSSRLARVAGAVLRRDPYFIEQGTFFLGYLGTLKREQPDLLYFADLNFGNAVWHWRERSGAKVRLLFYNGGNTTMPFTRCDHVQVLTPAARDGALSRGELPSRLTALPHGVDFDASWRPPTADARAAARRALRLPADGEVLLSVGQLDRSIKRTHLLIEAVAALEGPKPFLHLVGADGPERTDLCALATARLGDHWRWEILSREQMTLAYAAADRSALLSHGEGFGLAYVESLGAGLPLLVHDDPTTRYVVADAGIRRPISDAHTAHMGLRVLMTAPTDAASKQARHDDVHARFAWDALRAQYVAMFQRAAVTP
ncbi:MAG: glycosyltransferase family 4 protein [Gemmatimonadaceae bacterium]|nr:glycosyltransferase family 4 protein [Gemmatimonadaceae bacterium]